MIRSLRATLAVDAASWPAVERFVHDPAVWLPHPAEPVREGSWRTTLHVGVLHRGVELEVGPVWSLPDAWVRRVRWVATVGRGGEAHPAAHLPAFNGQLELRGQDDEEITLVLDGHYVPPFGRAGAAIDSVFMHRVAQTTADTLVAAITRRLVTHEEAWENGTPPVLGRRSQPR